MFLLVLDKNVKRAAQAIPDKLKFKQLLELCQLICSAGYSDIYKPIRQGKHIQEWIKVNQVWTKTFGVLLLAWCTENMTLKKETFENIFSILASVPVSCYVGCEAETAIFRYSKDYEDFTIFKTNSELPIKDCVKEYKKYVEWKKLNKVKGYM